MTRNTPVTKLPGVGKKVQEKLTRLGIKTIEDLVTHFPHRYEDFSNTKTVSQLTPDEKITTVARVLSIKTERTWRKRMMVTEAVVEDETGAVRAVWFNQPYIADTLKKELWVSFSSKVSKDKRGLYLANPSFEIIGPKREEKPTIHTGGLVPIYPETRGLTSRWLRWRIYEALHELGPFDDFLPEDIRKKHKLLDRDTAIRQIHFPKSTHEAQAAKHRLTFEELFLVHLATAREREKIKHTPAPPLSPDIAEVKEFVKNLPFSLTSSQRQIAWQILQDMERSSPMNRLLEGDVGSGKTVVAAIAALSAAGAGWQTAYLTPTEILAQQHYKTFRELLQHTPYEVALLTRSRTERSGAQNTTKKDLIAALGTADIPIVIGTHALVQKEVRLSKLGLVVVDEQHRFGVAQRAHLLKNQKLIPHLLSMTATPIPRTLALTLYGDLDLSLLKEMPKGRKQTLTKLVPPKKRNDAYTFIKKQVQKGRQVFVICPLIEESDVLEVRSATQEHEKLSKKIFPDLSVAMLHGRMKPQEKESVMHAFENGKTDILVATSVVEVGIDVPNATVMMIEGAERFGLAQLHQFRGRVGRSTHQSYCFLFTDSTSQSALTRLKALVNSHDGFALAEKDLKIRGPGEFFGKAQSGLPDLAMASLSDVHMLEETQKAVREFLTTSSINKHPKLARRVEQFQKEVHWE